MESLTKWLAENGSALWATIISFASVYGATLIAFVINVIRSKIAYAKQHDFFIDKINDLSNKIDKKLNDIENNIIENNDSNTLKRISKMEEIAKTAKKSNESLEEATPVNVNVSDIIDKLED